MYHLSVVPFACKQANLWNNWPQSEKIKATIFLDKLRRCCESLHWLYTEKDYLIRLTDLLQTLPTTRIDTFLYNIQYVSTAAKSWSEITTSILSGELGTSGEEGLNSWWDYADAFPTGKWPLFYISIYLLVQLTCVSNKSCNVARYFILC